MQFQKKNTLALILLCGATPVACLAQSDPFSSFLVQGQHAGGILLSRTTILSSFFFGSVTTDEAIARFIDVNNPPTQTPPALGECSSYQGFGLAGMFGFPFGDGGVLEVTSGPLFGHDLHAGSPLTLSSSGKGSSRNIPGGGPYWSVLSNNQGNGGFGFFSFLFGNNNSSYLNGGTTYTVTGPGGSGSSDVGQFSVTGTLPNFLQWTNSGLSSVDRNSPLTVNWTGPDNGDYVMILGVSGNSVFFCNATQGNGSFTVPSTALQGLSGAFGWFGSGALAVGTIKQIGTFSATGLDTGALFSGSIVAKNVTYR